MTLLPRMQCDIKQFFIAQFFKSETNIKPSSENQHHNDWRFNNDVKISTYCKLFMEHAKLCEIEREDE